MNESQVSGNKRGGQVNLSKGEAITTLYCLDGLVAEGWTLHMIQYVLSLSSYPSRVMAL